MTKTLAERAEARPAERLDVTDMAWSCPCENEIFVSLDSPSPSLHRCGKCGLGIWVQLVGSMLNVRSVNAESFDDARRQTVMWRLRGMKE